MWSYINIIVYLTITWIHAQKGRTVRQFYNNHGWDIRLSVPGEPGNDYPVLNTIPRTSFSCAKRSPGYYADIETNCQVFRVCTLGSTFSFQSFLCPNGTLFNQAVFVCDWWMNVDCMKSTQYYSSNKKYGNLRIGPQLMVDVKNMLTHSMRNPYNKIVTKNNLILTQEYIPPSEQPQVNSDYYNNNNERNLENYYLYEKATNNVPNQNILNVIDTFTASTASPQYIKNLNVFPPFTTKQLNKYQSSNDLQKSHSENSISNNQTYRLSQYNVKKPIDTITSSRQMQYLDANNRNILSVQRNYEKLVNNNEAVLISKQDLNQNHPNQFSQDYSQIGKKIQENSVSIDVPSTVISKTVSYRKIIPNPKQGQPKSRITFKTWILKPSRSARLTADPTPYTYNVPTSAVENIVAENSYFYNKPKIGLISTNTEIPLEISSQTTSYRQDSTSTIDSQRLVTVPSRIKPTVPSRLYLSADLSVQPKPALLYLPPTTYKPASLFYIPPSANPELLLKRNLLQSTDLTKSNYESSKLENNLYPVTKQSLVNSKHKNLTFSDILTKEKLDITVDDIVKNTKAIINAEAAKQINNIKEDIQVPENFYLPPETNSKSEEILTPVTPIKLSKSSRLTVSPSVELEPPVEIFENVDQNFNRFSNLPFIKDPTLPPNTIERTVSLKITIPEKVADLLFKNQSLGHSDNLELLNTGSSNYIILNKKETDKSVNNRIPIVKLTWNDNTNLSNSQDLVLSFLADSISSAKKYANVAKQEYLTQPSTNKALQNYNGAELEQITSRISDLTSSQYSINSNIKSHNKPTNLIEAQKQMTKYSDNHIQQKSLQRQRDQLTQVQQNQIPNNEDEKFQINSKNIYSGQLYQLPVPVVTQQIYNAPIKSSSNANKYYNKQYIVTKTGDKHQNKQSKSAETENIKNIYENPSHSEAHYEETANENELSENIQVSENKISALIHDKTVGKIQHPFEDNKVISYKKDKSYIVFSKLSDDISENQLINENIGNDFLIQNLPLSNDLSNFITFKLLPSISYKLENEEQKQHFLNTFEIDGQGKRKQSTNIAGQIDNQSKINADIINSVDQSRTFTDTQQRNNLRNLYDGPSSYSAPQLSIGSLVTPQTSQTESLNTEIDEFNSNENVNGYTKLAPSKRFFI